MNQRSFRQIISITLAGIGVAGSNPLLALFVDPLTFSPIAHILSALHLGFFKFVIISLMDICRKGTSRPTSLVFDFAVIVGCLFTVLEAVGSWQHAGFISKSEGELIPTFWSEVLLMQVEIVYSICLITLIVLAASQSPNQFTRRRIVISVLGSVDVMVGSILRFCVVNSPVFSYTIIPDLLRAVPLLVASAFILFLMGSDPEFTYRNVLPGKPDEMALMPDVQSDQGEESGTIVDLE
jgi:hypothetical protein